MVRFVIVCIFVQGRCPLRLRISQSRYLKARHHNQYPQHTGKQRLLSTSPTNHPRESHEAHVVFRWRSSRLVFDLLSHCQKIPTLIIQSDEWSKKVNRIKSIKRDSYRPSICFKSNQWNNWRYHHENQIIATCRSLREANWISHGWLSRRALARLERFHRNTFPWRGMAIHFPWSLFSTPFLFSSLLKSRRYVPTFLEEERKKSLARKNDSSRGWISLSTIFSFFFFFLLEIDRIGRDQLAKRIF